MPKTLYTVVQRDHMASIADGQGVASWAKIWNDPDNAELRSRRETPHTLLPGDVVTVPERDPQLFQRPTGAVHQFVVNVTPLKLRLAVQDEYGQPVANATGTLTVDGAEQDVQTDGNGQLEAPVANGAKSAVLQLGDRSIAVAIGHLDPIDETSGQLARLKGLGYFDPDVPEAADYDQEKDDVDVEVRLAWELFQDANGLPVTGAPDADSVDKLKDVFGG